MKPSQCEACRAVGPTVMCNLCPTGPRRSVQPPATPQDRVDVVAREIAKELMSNGFGDQGDRLAIRLGSQDFGGWSLDGAARQICITLEQEGYVLDRMAEATRRAQLLASAPPAVWQPIETAPKDGTPVLLFAEASIQHDSAPKPFIHVSRWVRETREWWEPKSAWEMRLVVEDAGHWESWEIPTHWMPLPSPPTPGENR